MSKQAKIAVLGGGAWGSALAVMLAGKHGAASGKIMLCCRDAAQAEQIAASGENRAFLPGIALPKAVRATADKAEALSGAELILAAVPLQRLRAALTEAKAFIAPQAKPVLCCKGLERGSGKPASQIARDILPNPLAVLSGPSFAADVARGLPAAVTLAAETPALAEDLARRLSSKTFRCYASTDIAGVETGGALKNVLALAAGMAAGRGLGASAQAALITRGFAELRRLCRAAGGREETLSGLAVLGDLVLTCSSAQSRNYSYGMALAKGEDLTNRPLAEGVATAEAAVALCRARGLEAPLIAMVAAVLAEEISIDAAARQLLARPLRFED